jgi:hypothetical protein
VSTRVPALLNGFVDDAAVFPPGNASLSEAVTAHRAIRTSWYADMVGPLLVPATLIPSVGALLQPDERIEVGLIGDTGLAGLPVALAAATRRLEVRQIEVAVAKRSEDPQPGLAHLIDLTAGMTIYAEIPLTYGLLGALDTVAQARRDGIDIAAKFRTGGLAAELFPTPIELAAVICACRDRGLPFKLTAGLHHAIRHADPETGFVHHGFLGILAGVLAAVHDEAEVADVAALLASTDPVPVVETVRRHLGQSRPLWIGFGTCSVTEPLADLDRLGLIRHSSTLDIGSESTETAA